MGLAAAGVDAEDDPARGIAVDLDVDLGSVVGRLVEEEARDRRWRVRHLQAGRVGAVAVEAVRDELASSRRVGGQLCPQVPVAHADVVRVEVATPRLWLPLDHRLVSKVSKSSEKSSTS